MPDTPSEEKIVGILGGMGPEATVDLMQRIIRLTPALDDIDHVRCIVDNNPKVPSRIRAIIEGGGTDPGPTLADMARRLESWGADFLAIACNTAHVYYDQVQQAVRIPVVHMADRVVDRVRAGFPHTRKVGILASIAIQMTDLYGQRFGRFGIDVVYPDSDDQKALFDLIRTIKTGDTGPEVVRRYREICRHLKDRGVTLAVVACTELSVLKGDLPVETLDAAEVLAKEIVDIAKNRKPAASAHR